jgi:hypothetical protein
VDLPNPMRYPNSQRNRNRLEILRPTRPYRQNISEAHQSWAAPSWGAGKDFCFLRNLWSVNDFKTIKMDHRILHMDTFANWGPSDLFWVHRHHFWWLLQHLQITWKTWSAGASNWRRYLGSAGFSRVQPVQLTSSQFMSVLKGLKVVSSEMFIDS